MQVASDTGIGNCHGSIHSVTYIDVTPSNIIGYGLDVLCGCNSNVLQDMITAVYTVKAFELDVCCITRQRNVW